MLGVISATVFRLFDPQLNRPRVSAAPLQVSAAADRKHRFVPMRKNKWEVTKMKKMKWAAIGTMALAAAAISGLSAPAQAQDTIKIGWAISKTGPFAAGAAVTTLPN